MDPLVLIEAGYNTWAILKPMHGFGSPITTMGFNGVVDRRYEEQCTVKGTLADALKVLHQLEAGQ